MVKKIKEFGKVVEALTELTLKLATLAAVAKLLLDSFK